VILAFTAAGALTPPIGAGDALFHSLFCFPVSLACFAVAGVYPAVFLHPAEEWRRIFWSSGVAATLFATICTFHLTGPAAPLLAGAAAWVLTASMVVALRTLLRKVLAMARWWGIRTIVIADGQFGLRLSRLVHRCNERGLRVVAWVGDYAVPTRIDARRHPFSPRDGSPADHPEYALIAAPGLRVDELSSIVQQYGRFRRLFLTWDMEGLAGMEADAGSISDLFDVSVRQNLACAGPRIVKRLLDLCVVSSVGILLLPLLAVLWLLVRVTSAGSGFYSHRRIGQAGKHFSVWKFRTMVVDADKVLSRYLERYPTMKEEWRLTHKLKNDPRNTAIGKILRKTSLDELPQLWNVLRGDMSLVGPRPIVDPEIKKYGPDFLYYLQVRPGVTGLWQVSGRNETSYEERVALDRFYVRNWSVWLDIYILARTVRTVFTGHGAY
jgi:Undecaprenyl-phosphate galactose phosphotransferase WbaP